MWLVLKWVKRLGGGAAIDMDELLAPFSVLDTAAVHARLDAALIATAERHGGKLPATE